jgi:hypothetical protein
MKADLLDKIRPMLTKTLRNFGGKVISGGTKSGIPGCVGEIAATLKSEARKHFELVGYIPKHLPADAPKDDRYDRIVQVDDDDRFLPGQILRMWEDFVREGVSPGQVMLIGFGGGPMTAVDYRVAFALGATVAVVANTGGASDEILADEIWTSPSSIMALPFDEASIEALTVLPKHVLDKVDEVAQAFHENYLKGKVKSMPENLRPWTYLPDTYKDASRAQAGYAVEILRAAGFEVRPLNSGPNAIISFADKKFDDDVKRMAELEHGRWNVERLHEGWRPGKTRDDDKKIHDCILAWEVLPDEIRKYDYDAVRAFPDILKKAGLEIYGS